MTFEDILKIIEAFDIVALIGVIASIIYATQRKSYEMLIKHRLESLDEIRKNMSKLLYMFSEEGINEYKRQECTVTEYKAKIIKIKYALHMQMKFFYVQEKGLFDKIEEVYELALSYFENPNNKNCLPCKLKELNELYANYDWALWLYHQELHKFTPNKTEKFDEMYDKVQKQISNSREGKK